MASGKSLELREIVRPAPQLFKRGNPEHYHAKGAAGRPHTSVPAELGDRRRYRAIVRRERQEAEQLRNRAKLARYGIDEVSGP
jgi:hypothetical protein